MRSIGRLGVVLVALAAGAALAQDGGTGNVTIFDTTPAPKPEEKPQPKGEGPHGFELGLRVGYALPMGDVVSGEALSDEVSGLVPVQLDVGYRIDPHWFAGVYLQYGPFFAKGCPDGASCSGYDARFGVEGQYHLLPTAKFDPWLGLGVGYEIGHTAQSQGQFAGHETNAGLEFFNLSLGGDYRVMPKLAVGPLVSLSVTQYSHFAINGATVDASNVSKSAHALLDFGVRGVFDFM